MATLFRTDGTTAELTLSDLPEGNQLERVQQLVGGYTKAITLTPDADGSLLLLVNESGDGLPVNPAATAWWRNHYPRALGMVRGDAILALFVPAEAGDSLA